jgi:hypothetical protein
MPIVAEVPREFLSGQADLILHPEPATVFYRAYLGARPERGKGLPVSIGVGVG